MERGLYVRPREVAVEGAVGTAVPRVASVNIIKGRLELVIKLGTTEVHALPREAAHRSRRYVRMGRVPGVGERTVVVDVVNIERPHSVLGLI